MKEFSVYESDKDARWWRKVANALAVIFTAFLMIAGLVGFKITSENKSLDVYRQANEDLRETAASMTEQFTESNVKIKDQEKEIKKLEDELFRLRVENASLKANANNSAEE